MTYHLQITGRNLQTVFDLTRSADLRLRVISTTHC